MSDGSRLDQFDIINTLGRGERSTVKLARCIHTGESVALKIFKPGNVSHKSKLLSQVRNEEKALSALDHPHALKVVSVHENGLYIRKQNKGSYACVYMVLEFCEFKDLFSLLSSGVVLDEPSIRKIYLQFIDMLNYIHSHGFCHQNLKLENLFIDSDANLKVGGFSLSSSVEDSLTEVSRNKQNYYLAPELLSSENSNGITADLYAAGIILFMLKTRRPPFSLASPTEPMYRLLQTNPDLFWKCVMRNNSMELSEEFKNLVSYMLVDKPSHRASLAEMKCHPWLAGPVASRDSLLSQLTDSKSKSQSESKASSKTVELKRLDFELSPACYPGASLSCESVLLEYKSASEVWHKLLDFLYSMDMSVTALPEKCCVISKKSHPMLIFTTHLYRFNNSYVLESVFRRGEKPEEVRSKMKLALSNVK